MASSIASQLQAIKSLVQADTEPLKRPFTRPSILFSPKAAADVDIETIYNLGLGGLESLVRIEERFGNYKNDLFSHKSRDLDRELVGREENDRIDASLSSFLRLLSGYLQHRASLETLEYLIRRYKIHVYNSEDLVLCALPYHDTHAFVRIVQLIKTGNDKWKFLDAVKTSGAPLPRSVIVQQCVRDMQVLEVLCEYASRTKKYQPSKPVVNFCTAIIVGVLGSITPVDSDVVKRILPFVDSGFQPGVRDGSDHQAGALMIIGLLANRSTLDKDLFPRFIRSIAEIAHEHAKDSSDPQWLRLSFMALINFVQLQPVKEIPKKALNLLKEIRDISGVLLGLSKEFSINGFLVVLLHSFLRQSSSDDQCCQALTSIIDTVPINNLVDRLISEVFSLCMMSYQKGNDFASTASGSWAKKILLVIGKNYPAELHKAVSKFMEDSEVKSKKEGAKLEMLSRMLDGNSVMSQPFLDSKLWFRLHHPKAAIRRAALSSLNGVIKVDNANSESLVTVQDAILRQLWDDDLTVVQAALSLDRLCDILSASDLMEAVLHVVKRCTDILTSGLSRNVDLAVDVVASSLKVAISGLYNLADFDQKVTATMFPFLLVQPKTWKLNVHVLELVKEVNWPLCKNLAADDAMKKVPDLLSGSLPPISKEVISNLGQTLALHSDERRLELIESFCNFKLSELVKTCNDIKLTEQERCKLQKGLLIRENLSSLNMDIISKLAKMFMMRPGDHMKWITDSCRDCPMSKTLFFMLLIQSVHMMNSDSSQILDLFEVTFPVLKSEWEDLEVAVDVSLKELSKSNCQELLYQLIDADIASLNSKLLNCLYWKFLESFIKLEPVNAFSVSSRRLVRGLEDLFYFFATARARHVFKEHLQYRVNGAKVCPVYFLTGLVSREDVPAEVQIESLKCFLHLCSNGSSEWLTYLFPSFPVLLIPLSSDNQDIKVAAMNCIEALYHLWCRVDFSSKKNGNAAVCSGFYDELLGLIVQQRRLILSDNNFLPSILTSLLSSTSDNLLVPVDLQKRFDQSTKEKIISFILLRTQELPAYGKLRIMMLLKGLGVILLHDKNLVSLLSQLLDRRTRYYFKLDETCQQLSDYEVKILCLLLECAIMPSPASEGHSLDDHILNALQIDCKSPEDPAVMFPCLTVLDKLNSQFYVQLKAKIQDRFFHKMVSLFRSANGNIQNAVKDAVLRLEISCSTVVRTLDPVIHLETLAFCSLREKKKQKKNSASCIEDDVNNAVLQSGEKALCFVASLLDVLLLKKDLRHRESLIRPLLKLLGRSMTHEWVKIAPSSEEASVQSSQDVLQTIHSSISSIQHTVLLILKNICDSLMDFTPLKADLATEINVNMLVELAHSSNDGVTRNYVFSLFTSIVKVVPDKILDHIISILTLVGESTVTQIDSHSKSVFEEFISSVVPFWLSKTNSEEQLLQIFVKVLPDVTEHRRLSIVTYLLGIIGEQKGLPSLLVLLFRSLVSRQDSSWFDDARTSESFTPLAMREWEYAFAVKICEKYSSITWLSSLVVLLENINKHNPSGEFVSELLLVLEFVFQKLQDPEFAFLVAHEPRNDVSDGIQQKLLELMKGCIFLLQAIDAAPKGMDVSPGVRKDLRIRAHAVLMTTTAAMDPSVYFKGITSLLQQSDSNVTKKVLGLLSETAKDTNSSKVKHNMRRVVNPKRKNPWLNLDEVATESFGKMCEEIVHQIDHTDDELGAPAKQTAVSTLEVLANRFPSGHPIFSKCLRSVAKGISSKNVGVSSNCLHTTASFVNVLGPKALPELPRIMRNLIKISHEVSSVSRNNGSTRIEEESLLLSILVTLEAVVDKLGGFLNPYLGDIVKLVVLRPEFVSELNQKFKFKADAIRELITEKIPVRLTLQPLLKIYDEAVYSGDRSLVIAFEILANLVVKMDKSSIGGYHGKIFDQCLLALDIRRQNPASVQNIDVVERSIINAIIALTKKLTESMFKPLFIRSIEWAESDVENMSGGESKSIDRAISFYGFVNQLSESHRSLFVPYFKYLLDGIVSHLTSMEASISSRKKKKAKIQEAGDAIPPKSWHLRALVLSSLKNCFLYDTGSVKFLDSNNFQVLLKPIVSQIVVEPPASLDDYPYAPSVLEVDELLVSCIGQMAVAAGSDLLWKPLNHEVLMQTRSEKLRARILGLRTVKQFLDNLKEEYMVFLAETIPFLGELLEDVELSVKSLAQDILKQMEEMSGESLRQYL
ncbi:PREDICTED: uncharacterized protein At3g06530 [Tarenaya hassleriana]|uniref:uncharacterized protein At3g06530 n=1 Tax=Tarenaya hassleriana TaxID=28532 RepID=UPI00053C66A7|nr:PREDICTED: uncharacterized protein At3g06530 [Tarenaya hassleriana]